MGRRRETAALEHPEWLREIHSAYLDAGSPDRVCQYLRSQPGEAGPLRTDGGGGGPRRRLCGPGGGPGPGLVALDVGPIGQLLEPTGTLEFEQAVDIFAEVVEAGAAAGADLIAIETMTDLQGGPGRPAGGQRALQPAGAGDHDL